jgi:hypothetical protein
VAAVSPQVNSFFGGGGAMWASVIMVYVISIIFVVGGFAMTAILPSQGAVTTVLIGVMGAVVGGSLYTIARRVAALEKRVSQWKGEPMSWRASMPLTGLWGVGNTSSIPPSEPASQERQHRENKEDEEEDLRPFPWEACNSSEAKECSDQSNDEENDSQS